ncbi:uncharacterized protein A1O5_00763 [Cladophialophora psammophila CBS 110553]|uniref:Heterokaryon incompatibility domain-containing protein n=1 Tax=Cladophialophora psammophila CBS 110553 TaxID=1182543 RepID=W9XFX8_9EURO|nr:uncharacterized protein A1O5_00763 [Cladophialophora psammophila CBS 110553]EXJ76255.1 hypothetical protein A1O5_00763 [Cladophialophora psammophila CBS 110553]
MEKFEYQDLPGEDHIRIMELLPGTNDDRIQIHLASELRQDTIDTYAAISYTWDTLLDPIEIICCNKLMFISANLADALRAIRSKKSEASLRLWADAICIDQRSDSEEKNHQVKHMGEIYKNAQKVFVWLGSDKDGIAKDCFDMLKSWNLYLDKQLDVYKKPRKIPPLQPPRHLCNDAKQGEKLTKLMGLPWFRRVWVLQEAALAQECQLHWGNHNISLAELMEFACFFDGRPEIARLVGVDESTFRLWRIVFSCVYRTYGNPKSWRSDKPLIKALNEKHGPRSGLLLDILQVGKSFSATCAGDHIYAFLGNPLAFSDDGRLFLEPDYNKEEGEICFDAAVAFLKCRREAGYLLCFVQHSSADEVTGNSRPSWIPRWTNPVTDRTPWFTIGNLGLSFNAGGSVDRLQYRVESGLGAERLLTVEGLVFDHLSWTSDVLEPENFAVHSRPRNIKPRTSQLTCIDELWNAALLAYRRLSVPTEVSESSLFYEDYSYTLVTGYRNGSLINLRDHRKWFDAYLQALREPGRPRNRNDTSLPSRNQADDDSRYEMNMKNCRNQRLALTRLGRFALVPQFAEPGDTCCVFLGMVTPFIVRAAEMANIDGRRHHHLVGEAYVYGVMQGELVNTLDRADIEKEEIVLV